jgi:hypothetical protein
MLKNSLDLGFPAIFLAAILLFGANPGFAQSKDLLIGTWVLNFGKSDFKLRNPPTGKTLTFVAADNGFTLKASILNANGGNGSMMDRIEFTAKYDGAEYPMPSESPLNGVTLKKIDAAAVEQSGIKRGKIVETVTYRISGAGKVLTVTTVGKDDPSNDTVQVYDKE